jgi:hypothetical protein
VAYQKNIKINQNNIVQISGSLITLTGSVSGSQISGSRLQSTIVSASNLFAGGILYPTADGDAGQVMVTDGAGTLTFQEPVAGDLVIRVKNREATTILKGTPCYITASNTSGNIAGILRADANNPARMPAACVAFEDILADAEGTAILAGFINEVNTNGFTSGQAVYVAVGGGYTNIRPTGSALVQPLGYIEKVGVNGSGVVQGPGHHYILPNITANHIWVGGANGVPVELNKEVFATTGSNTFVGSQIISGSLSVTGQISSSGNITAGNDLQANGDGTIGALTTNSTILNIRTISTSGTIDLARNTSISGTLRVIGSTIISNNLTVSGSITELSTRRIKTNIVSLDDELTTISKLNPVSYTRIDDGRKEYGFISEEVKEIYPEFVVGEGINYPKMVSILVSAVKELSEKVEKQSVEIDLLKNKKKTTRGKK